MPKYRTLDVARATSMGRLLFVARAGGMALVACIALGLSACGGGSGVKASPPPPPPPPQPPPPPVEDGGGDDTTPLVVTDALVVARGESVAKPVILESSASLDNQGLVGGADFDIAVQAEGPSEIRNQGGGVIRGGSTAIYMEHGGSVENGAGSIIEATNADGSDCGPGVPCAIYVGPDPDAGYAQYEFTLVNEGTIIGNVQMTPTAMNRARLVAGSVIRGDLDMGSQIGSHIELDGEAGTVQRYSDAVTGSSSFSGGVAKVGKGTWVIDTDDMGLYSASVDGGSLQFGDGGTAGSIPQTRLTLWDGKVIFDRSDDVMFGGAIIGSHDAVKKGTLVQAGTGVLTLTHTTLIRPDFIVIEEGGTLQIHNSGGTPGRTENMSVMAPIANDGALVVNSRSNISLGGVISGAGSVTQNGSATLILSAGNTYSGGTTVNNGVLLAAETIPGDVVVSLAGTLGSAGFPAQYAGVPRVAGGLSNAGTVVVSTHDTSVGGSYTQASTGTLAVSLGSKLDVAGTATLDGGTLIVTGADGDYAANTHTEVLSASGGITGTFDELVKGAGVVFTATTINYDANSVWLDTTGLDITQAAAGNGIGYTLVSMNSAQRVQGAFEQLNRRLAAGDPSGISGGFLRSAGQFQQASTLEMAQASLRSLSGQLHAASAAMTFRAIDAGNQALSDRLHRLRGGNPGFGMWTQHVGSDGGMARAGFDGVGFQLDGWLVGHDVRVGGSGVAGFAFGEGLGRQQLVHGFDRNDSHRTEGMLYAGLAHGPWYAQGRVGFGHVSQDVNRRLLLGEGAESVWTRYDGDYRVAYGEGGFNAGRDGGIVPFVSLEYARSDRDAFSEQGSAGFGLRSDAQAFDRLQAGMGVRARQHWNLGDGRSVELWALAGWQRTLASHGDVFEASFVGLQQWAPLLGIGPSRHTGRLGVGLDARMSRHATLRLGFDYENGEYDSAHGMSAGLNLAF